MRRWESRANGPFLRLSVAAGVANYDGSAQRRHSLGHMAAPEEIANLVVWLASDEARYVTATTVFFDGGMMQFSPGL